MRYSLQLVTAPIAEPVTLDELTNHARLETLDPSQQLELKGLIQTAREDIEEYTAMVFMPQTWDVFLDYFPLPSEDVMVAAAFQGRFPGPSSFYGAWPMSLPLRPLLWPLELPIRPLQSVTYIHYLDINNVLQTWDPALYSVDSVSVKRRPRITPAYGQIWPISLPVPNAVQIRVLAGYAADASQDNPAVNVPARVKHALKLLAAHYYENREASLTDGSARQDEISLGYTRLLDGFRLSEFA